MPGYRDLNLQSGIPLDYYRNRPYAAGNVAPQEPITASVPIREVGGSVVPAPDTSGLYAIYGRKNPYESAAQQPGGTGINFAAPVAAFLSGKFESKKNADIKEWSKRKDAYDKIQAKKEDVEFNAKMTEEALKAGQTAYFGALENGGDHDAASKAGTQAVNAFSSDNGVAIPPIKAINFWKGGDASLASSKEGGGTITLVKRGDVYAWNDGGKMRPVPKDAMGFGDLARITTAERPKGGADPRGMLEFYDANGNLVAKTKNQAEAIKAGAVSFGQWIKSEDPTTGNIEWKINKVPLSSAVIPHQVGNLGAAAPGGTPPPPERVKAVAQNYMRPNPVPGSPGSGQQPAPAVQPAPAPKPAQTPTRAWMINPAGKRVMIEGSVDDALKAGYKLAQ